MSAEAVLCTHKTASSASLVLEICPNFANPYLTQFSSISGGNCIISDDDEIQPDPIRSDQRTPTHTQATNRFRTSSSTIPTSGINRTRRILPVIQGTFAAIERAENYLPLQPFFNNTPFGQTLINCIHNQHRIGIPDEYFVETCINTTTHNGFVTKEFVKTDEVSQTRDYTIVYINSRARPHPSPLTTKTALTGCFLGPSLKLETF